MLRPLSCVLALLVALALWRVAVANPDPIVNELSQLRQAVGGSGVDAGEFERAARNVVQQQQPFDVRTGRRFQSEPARWESGQVNGFQDAAVFDPRQATGRAESYVSPPAASPVTQLRAKAFELDKLAHQLETASKYDDADAIREAAQSLRGLARKMATKADRPVAAGYQLPAGPVGTLQPPRIIDPPAPPRGVRGGPTDQLEGAIEAARDQLRPSQPTQSVEPPPAAVE